MIISFNELTDGGRLLAGLAVDPGGEIFFESDILALKNLDADGLMFVNVEYLENGDSELSVVESIAALGIKNGMMMNDPSDILALPCPPHCGSGKGGLPISSSGNITLEGAVDMFLP